MVSAVKNCIGIFGISRLTYVAKYDIFTQVKCIDREFLAKSLSRERTAGVSAQDVVQIVALEQVM